MSRLIRPLGTTPRPVLSSAFSFAFSISADTQDYDLYTELVNAGWNESDPVEGTVTVESGVYVGSTSTSSPSFTVDPLPADSAPKLVNKGTIEGAAGGGGDADSSAANDGSPGGPALDVDYPLTVDNGSGQINGGAGGGGGAFGVYFDGSNAYSAVAGGGGGAGYDAGAGGSATEGNSNDSGSPGTKTSGGAGGSADALSASADGGSGGNPGQSGASGSASGNASTDTGAGGGAGNAIEGTSNITWESGSGNVAGPTTT